MPQMKISSPLISYFKISNRLLAITVLLLAAGLKWHQLITSPYTGNMVLESRLITAALVAAEIALAGWLISGVQAKMARWTAVAAFFVFLLATLRRLWKGDASCGCFGIVEVSPLITAVLDVIVIWSLALPVASECTVGKGDLNDLLRDLFVLSYLYNYRASSEQ